MQKAFMNILSWKKLFPSLQWKGYKHSKMYVRCWLQLYQILKQGHSAGHLDLLNTWPRFQPLYQIENYVGLPG